jgi:putative hemolysin
VQPQTISNELLKSTPTLLRSVLRSALSYNEVDAVYSAVTSDARPFVCSLLDRLLIRLRFSEGDRSRIPRSGAVIVVANHPTGMLDGAALLEALRPIRPDVKILANGLLSAIPELALIVIPLDLVSESTAARSRNAGSVRAAIEHLAGGGLLVIFPAGEVARFDWRRASVVERPWQRGVARLVRLATKRRPDLTVAPVFVGARSSRTFRVAGALSATLRIALMPRELVNARGSETTIRVARPVPVSRFAESDDDAMLAYLRWRTELLGAREDYKAKTRLPLRALVSRGPLKAVVDAQSIDEMRAEIAALPPDRRLASGEGLAVFVAVAGEIPTVLREIGRLRELTFRAAGEGTGRAVDLDRYDQHYWHLFLWNEATGEVVGAYRLVGTDTAGVAGLYTAELFEYGDAFLRRIGPALELGRSFVRPECQRSFAPLLLLWKGIGKFVARNPRYRVLFGPVSVSNDYHALSRELMVSYLERAAAFTEWLGYVRARTPFRRTSEQAEAALAQLDLDELSDVVSDIEGDERGIPVLLRQYLRLGGRLLGFNVDPDFSNSLDGLIVVDLMRTERKLLDRYLGKTEAAEFLAYQKGQTCTARVS